MQFVFVVCQVEDYWNILKLSCRPLVFTSYKAYLKSKTRSGTNLPVSFSACVFKKNISLVIFYFLTKCHCLVAFTSWVIGQDIYCNCLLTRLWRHNFEINLIFLTKSFFSTWPKSQDKNLNSILRTERAFNMK